MDFFIGGLGAVTVVFLGILGSIEADLDVGMSLGEVLGMSLRGIKGAGVQSSRSRSCAESEDDFSWNYECFFLKLAQIQ